MSIIGTFNDYNIYDMPSSPGPRSIEFTANDLVATSTGEFSAYQQAQDWGVSWLEATVTMPPMTHAQAQVWIAWLLQMRGQLNMFQLPAPIASIPMGSGTGTPVVNGASQTGYQLATKGWTASAENVLLPGDWLQIGYRLYKCLDTVSADANGDATFNIWPQLRESPSDGDSIILNNPKGLFRLSSNKRQWSITETQWYGMMFQIREAI
jgi:hypothetical protein